MNQYEPAHLNPLRRRIFEMTFLTPGILLSDGEMAFAQNVRFTDRMLEGK